MKIRLLKLIFVFLLLLQSMPLTSEVEALHRISDLGITEFRLSNGLRVCIKDTGYGDQEVEMRLCALGGHYALPLPERAAMELCVDIGWKSGVGSFSYDKMSALLYENEIDFQPAIHAYQRMVEISTTNTGIEPSLHLIQLLFTQKKFDQMVFEQVIEEKKKESRCFHQDPYHLLEYTIRATNTNGYSHFCELKDEQLDRIDFQQTKKYYESAFQNPDEFVLVIVGGINVDEVVQQVEQKLSSIPKSQEETEFKIIIPDFPKGITPKTVKVPRMEKSMACITFPLANPLVTGNEWENVTLVRLLQTHLGDSVHVFLDFPFYPIFDEMWLTIRFQADFDEVNDRALEVLNKIENFVQKGPTEEEFHEAIETEIMGNPYWLRHKDYWAETLCRYYLSGWDPKGIIKKPQMLRKQKWEDIYISTKKNLDLKQYSVVSLYSSP